jgi:hypothetical protein
MRVKIVAALPGAVMNLSPGDEEDFPAEDAVRLIAQGYAIPIAPPVERAVKKPVETRKRKK